MGSETSRKPRGMTTHKPKAPVHHKVAPLKTQKVANHPHHGHATKKKTAKVTHPKSHIEIVKNHPHNGVGVTLKTLPKIGKIGSIAKLGSIGKPRRIGAIGKGKK